MYIRKYKFLPVKKFKNLPNEHLYIHAQLHTFTFCIICTYINM